MKKFLLASMGLLWSVSLLNAAPAELFPIEDTKNSYKVSKELYRSGQPDDEGFEDCQKKGIRSVLNLREYHSDDKEAKKTNLKLFRMRLAAGSITEDDLLKCLQIIHNAPKPILVHCWHGSDRTGVVVAAYRIVNQGWQPEKAIEEFMEPKYGHHKKYYKNLSILLKEIDWANFKKKFQLEIAQSKKVDKALKN